MGENQSGVWSWSSVFLRKQVTSLENQIDIQKRLEALKGKDRPSSVAAKPAASSQKAKASTVPASVAAKPKQNQKSPAGKATKENAADQQQKQKPKPAAPAKKQPAPANQAKATGTVKGNDPAVKTGQKQQPTAPMKKQPALADKPKATGTPKDGNTAVKTSGTKLTPQNSDATSSTAGATGTQATTDKAVPQTPVSKKSTQLDAQGNGAPAVALSETALPASPQGSRQGLLELCCRMPRI
ncbi:hypothetical protein FS837_003682 [Tulasnella sp. UAMH 9824]|nr:hypothetical protein FS837_003682 [Tulasnella sp. UAMH 9824]